jgi:hypothetical protein
VTPRHDPISWDKLADEALRRIGDHIVEILTQDIQEASENGLLRPVTRAPSAASSWAASRSS